MYRTIIMPVVLYECESWFLTLREEHMLGVFENMVLRGIFGTKRCEMVGGWRKLHNEELHNLYSSPEGERPLGGDNMKMDLREMGWGDTEWINLPQVRDRWLDLVNMVMNLRVQ
jgi:hypothetical protein